MTDHEKTRRTLLREIWTYFYNLHEVSNRWGVVLLDPSFDNEPEVRNTAFAIWLWALAENASESFNSVQGLKRKAKHANAKTAEYYLDIIAHMHVGLADLIGILSFDDMVLIREHRMRAVHGRLRALHAHIYYSDGKRVHKRKISSEQSHQIVTDLWRAEGWSKQITEARYTIMSRPALIWTILGAFWSSKAAINRVMDDIRQWDNALTPGVLISFIDNCYLATQEHLKGELRSFWHGRQEIALASPPQLDPVVARMHANAPRH